MIINWGLSRLYVANAIPAATSFYVWPTAAPEIQARVTQLGVATATTTGQVNQTQLGVIPATTTGLIRLTQLGVIPATFSGQIFVTQVGVIVMTRPLPCPGLIIGQRTDGLPYVPDAPDPCSGPGVISGSRTGA